MYVFAFLIPALSLEQVLFHVVFFCSVDGSQLDLLTSLEPVSPDFGFVQMNEHLPPQYAKATGEM